MADGKKQKTLFDFNIGSKQSVGDNKKGRDVTKLAYEKKRKREFQEKWLLMEQ